MYFFLMMLIFAFSCNYENPQITNQEKEAGLSKTSSKNKFQNPSNSEVSDSIVAISDERGNLIFLTKKTQEGFEEMYWVQMNENKAINITDEMFMGHINREEQKLLVFSDNSLAYFFAFDEDVVQEQPDGIIAEKCYGISKQYGLFRLTTNYFENVSNIFDILVSVPFSDLPLSEYGSELDCTSGGPGATECSVDSSIASVATGCSVSCSDGFYACCDSSTSVCKCVEDAESCGDLSTPIVMVPQPYDPDEPLGPEEPDDPTIIYEAEIHNDCIRITFSAIGCDGDTWKTKLLGGNISESNPPRRMLRLSVENEEDCDNTVTKTMTYDISNLQIEEKNEIYLNIVDWNESLLYEY